MLSFLKGNLNCYYCISIYCIKIALLFGFNIKMNDFDLNTHHEALRVKNKQSILFFAACTNVTVTNYFFKFVTVFKLVTSSFLKVTCPLLANLPTTGYCNLPATCPLLASEHKL